jgi:hypothetical protein
MQNLNEKSGSKLGSELSLERNKSYAPPDSIVGAAYSRFVIASQPELGARLKLESVLILTTSAQGVATRDVFESLS